jgi:5-methyltetrahydrofolate--homocysteine methyltransferase
MAASRSGREQVAEGSNSLDVCTAFVGRDEMAEMNEVVRRFTSSVNSPPGRSTAPRRR